MADTYLNIAGNRVKLVDLGDGSYGIASSLIGSIPVDNIDITFSALRDALAGECGTATGGTKTTVVDTSKDIGTDTFKDKTIKLTIGGVNYYRKISASAGTTVTFATLPGTPDTAVWGVAEGPQITVVTVADGDSSYTLEAVPAPGDNDNPSASLADGVITVYLGKTAGELDGAKNTGIAIAAVVDQIPEVTASMTGSGGAVAVTEDPVEFTGGVDPVEVEAGDTYVILKE